MAAFMLVNLCRSAGVQRQAMVKGYRGVSSSVRWCSSSSGEKASLAATEPTKPQQGRPPVNSIAPDLKDHKVSKLEKYILVWAGKYKSVDEVPNLVRQDIVERASNIARIKISLWMCAATVLGCLAMVYMGKKAHSSGESVTKMNLDWHKNMNKEK